MRSFVLTACLLSPTLVTAQDTLPESLRKSCELVIQSEMAKRHIPGLTVAVGRGDRVLWSKGFGYSDLENQVPAKPATSYRLASISKPITAVAAMRLVVAGKFDIDKPVQHWLPKFPEKRWPLTSRHLLSHLGGVRHYKGGEIRSTKHYPTVQSALVIFRDDPLLHEPGTRFRYTTYGYNLLGACVAAAAGRRFEDVVREQVFAPAGMAKTRVDHARRLIPHRAQGYVWSLGKHYNSAMVDTSNKLPGGGLCGTASDLVRFGLALANGELLPAKVLDEMWTPARTKAGKALKYGLGFFILRARKPRVVGHSGGQPRVSTMLLLRPDERIAVAVMCNLENAGAAGIARRVSGLLGD